MSEKKTRAKKVRPKSDTVATEILAALAEFTEALESGEVAAHLHQRKAKIGDVTVATYELGTRKKPPTPRVDNRKKARS
jgi:hypothetical protein